MVSCKYELIDFLFYCSGELEEFLSYNNSVLNVFFLFRKCFNKVLFLKILDVVLWENIVLVFMNENFL